MWVKRTDLALLAGLQTSRLDQLRHQFGKGMDHGAGPSMRIHAPSWLAHWRDYRSRNSPGDATHGERLKKANADIAEEKLKIMRGEVVLIADVEADYLSVGAAIRSHIERLCPHCQENMREGLLAVKELKTVE